MAANKGGIVNNSERVIGNYKPINKPYFQPQINPHKNTGICIGNNILPICGNCPVKKGKTIPKLKNKADKTRL